MRWPLLTSLACGLLLAGCGLLNWSEPGGGAARPRRIEHRAPAAAADRYVVERGDTLYSIAFRNQLDYHDLASWNGIGRDYRIQVGQTLRLTPPAGMPVPAPGATGASPTVAGSSPRRPITTPSSPATQTAAAEAGDSDVAVAAWRWPTRGQVVDRFDPNDGQKGIDIAGSLGQVVVATAPGKVVYSGSALKGYGELVIVKHNETYLSAYGYNRRRLVEEGQQVRAGQPIAELGVGPEQKPMLHFEIRDKGRPVDPLSLLPRP